MVFNKKNILQQGVVGGNEQINLIIHSASWDVCLNNQWVSYRLWGFLLCDGRSVWLPYISGHWRVCLKGYLHEVTIHKTQILFQWWSDIQQSWPDDLLDLTTLKSFILQMHHSQPCQRPQGEFLSPFSATDISYDADILLSPDTCVNLMVIYTDGYMGGF